MRKMGTSAPRPSFGMSRGGSMKTKMKAANGGSRWTQRDERVVMDDSLTDEEKAAKLHRSAEAVKKRRWLMENR